MPFVLMQLVSGFVLMVLGAYHLHDAPVTIFGATLVLGGQINFATERLLRK